MSASVVRVGVAGLGTVGGSAVRLLLESRLNFSNRLGAEIRIDAVCDRQAAREAARLGLPRGTRRYRDWQDLARDPGLDIAVETMGGLDDARRFVLEALRSGKHVVTANKRLLAHHWDEILRAAAGSGRQVRFEASVAGGIPLLQAIDQSLAANRVERVFGILNGTTNYILTRMAHEGCELDAALAEAQRLGFAEKNPAMDLDGTDAAHKVAVVAALLTGRGLGVGAVAHSGITDIRAEDLRFAASELGRAARLLGMVEIDWKTRPLRLTAFVAPTLVPLSHPLAGVHGEYNAVMVQASAAGDLLFYGKGAGAGPAGSAVAGDVFLLSQEILRGNFARNPSVGRRETTLIPFSETRSAFYVRLRVADRPGVLSRLTGVLGRRGISIAQIRQDRPLASPKSHGADVPVFLTTHPTRQGEMDRALREILAFSFVSPRHVCMRML